MVLLILSSKEAAVGYCTYVCSIIYFLLGHPLGAVVLT